MAQTFEKILNSEILSEDVKTSISEAFTARLAEMRDEITAELREEFANRYENDKEQIVGAMDAMLSDAIKAELTEFANDKASLRKEKMAYKTAIREHTKKLDKQITEALSKEVTELREDRKAQKQNFGNLENFVLTKLTEELNEFHIDKRALTEQRVRMVKEGKRIISEAKVQFIKNAAAKADKIIESALRGEINILKEDIKTAKENKFGRKIFETFATEFMTSAMSEGTQITKLTRQLKGVTAKLDESKKILADKDKAIMEAKRETKITKDMSNRKAIMNEMLNPLSKDQREVMNSLLESVKTDKLRDAYDKYLPTVLSEKVNKTSQNKAKLTEGMTVLTGDRASRTQTETEGSAEIIRIKKLAGLS